MSRESRESLATAFGVVLVSAILALGAGVSLVLGALGGLAAAARGLARERAEAVRVVEDAHAEALSRCGAALVSSLVLLSFGGAVAWRLVLRGRARSHAARARARLARVGLLAGTVTEGLREPLVEARELVAQLKEQLDEQPAWSAFAAPAESCDQILGELERVDAVVRDFLAYARPEPAPPRIVDVSALVRDWVAALEPELAARDLALVAEGLAPATTAIADAAGLKQILWSLVRNARDAAPRGTIVRVILDRDPERVRIRVVDRGPGIPPEHRDEVFEPFVSTKPDATGLGLAVALRLADAMGATLSVCGGPPGAVLEVALRRAPPSARFLLEPPRALQRAED